jgi:hypothetical protein
MKDKLKWYDELRAATGCYIAIGGSIALYVQNDPSIDKSSYVPGDIDVSVATEEDLAVCRDYLLKQGYTVKYTVDNPFMFTLRQQFINAEGEKHDFFINPSIKMWSSEIEGRVYTNPSLVWAARAQYAANNHAKAFDQFVAAGMVSGTATLEIEARRKAKRFFGLGLYAKRALFATLLKVVSLRSPEYWKVGAIYRKGWKISWGYNKSAVYGQHAEDMAISRFEKWYKEEAKGGVMWCTFSACTCCTKNLKARNMHSSYVHKYVGKL